VATPGVSSFSALDTSAAFASGTVITLTATPDANSTFSGWGPTMPVGLCSGTGTCQLTMSGQRTVQATFAPILHQLTASRDGDGSGTVASDIGGIDCGGTCPACGPGQGCGSDQCGCCDCCALHGDLLFLRPRAVRRPFGAS